MGRPAPRRAGRQRPARITRGARTTCMRAHTVCPADCRLDEGLRAFLRAVLADEWLPL